LAINDDAEKIMDNVKFNNSIIIDVQVNIIALPMMANIDLNLEINPR